MPDDTLWDDGEETCYDAGHDACDGCGACVTCNDDHYGLSLCPSCGACWWVCNCEEAD